MKKVFIILCVLFFSIFLVSCKKEIKFNMEELSGIDLLYPEADAKNLFVCDDKKSKYYLISVKSDKRVDLKEFKEKYKTEDFFNEIMIKRETKLLQMLKEKRDTHDNILFC